jgi:7-carboxy-7-deazaguanine synthase
MGHTINLSSEATFYTIQGEGKYIGYPSVFCRTSTCNLKCHWVNTDGTSTICDTPHTSFNPEVNMTDIGTLVSNITSYNCQHIVITGGEPFLQKNLSLFIEQLKQVMPNCFITIETNGTLYSKTLADFISISPKLSSSGMDLKYGKLHNSKRINLDSLKELITNHEYQLKFVINDHNDISEILQLRDQLQNMTGFNINDNIWVMPQGIEDTQLQSKMKWLWDVCKEYKWKYSDRLHVRCYGHIKGV